MPAAKVGIIAQVTALFIQPLYKEAFAVAIPPVTRIAINFFLGAEAIPYDLHDLLDLLYACLI